MRLDLSGRSLALALALFLSILFGLPADLWYIVPCGILGLLVPELTLRGFSASRTLCWGVGAALVITVLAALIYSQFTGEQVYQGLLDNFIASSEMVMKFSQQDRVVQKEMLEAMRSMTETMVRLFPALMTITLFAVAAIIRAVYLFMGIRRGLPLVRGIFNDYRNPEYLVLLLIAAGFAMLAGIPQVSSASLNVLVVLAVLYFMQGLAVALTLIARQAFAGFLRLLMYFFLILQPLSAILLVVLGVFDLWGDFRTPKIEENL